MKTNQTKIAKLISELCPNGVEFFNLSDVTWEITERNRDQAIVAVRSVTNANGLVATEEYFDNSRTSKNTSNYKIVSSGNLAYNPSRINVGSWAFNNENQDVIVSPMYVVVRLDQNRINKNYFEIFLNSHRGKTQIISKVEPGARFRLPYNSFAKIKIPIPPLAIQQEIVKILDNFTELEAELGAELEARKKQYEYYRSDLLKSGDSRIVTLSEVAEYSRDRVSAEDLDEKTYLGVDSLLQDKRGRVDSNHVPNSGNSTRYKENDILIGNIRPYLKKIWFSDCIGGTNGDVLVVSLKNSEKDNIEPRFLYHILSSDDFFSYNTQNSKGTKMPRGDKNAIMRYEFQIPEICEQKHIVSILDKFDALINSISEGLPAEIDARRKQYEYYRNQLLTFKELEK